MKVVLKQIGSDALFEGVPAEGNPITIHSPREAGTTKQGPSPMENLLLSAAGCTAVDVIIILKKMKQPMENLTIEIEGERQEIDDAKPFRKIHLLYKITGEVDQKKADRAAKLAVEKYCSVLESLHPDIKVSFEVIIL
ncbi:MAG: OsmC family protein [Saprospiraceae bacterium]|nr:OsmC family protein [Saprospiraceae bacterium]